MYNMSCTDKFICKKLHINLLVDQYKATITLVLQTAELTYLLHYFTNI